MSSEDAHEEAVDVLQQHGLKEYEARCFVGLARLPSATAKRLSEVTDVPRTRIYDAVRVLEANGLVEVQHSSPQQFRAVPLEEAVETLRDQYESRLERLEDALDGAEATDNGTQEPVQEVWAMTGGTAIANRTEDLVSEAAGEVVLILGDKSLFTDRLVASLENVDGDVDLIVGAVSDSLQRQIHDAIPEARTFTSELGWLRSEVGAEEEVAIGRLLLVDRSTILVSSIVPRTGEEHAVFGGGFGNGLVVAARRLMAQGLLPTQDPSTR